MDPANLSSIQSNQALQGSVNICTWMVAGTTGSAPPDMVLGIWFCTARLCKKMLLPPQKRAQGLDGDMGLQNDPL